MQRDLNLPNNDDQEGYKEQGLGGDGLGGSSVEIGINEDDVDFVLFHLQDHFR